MTIRTVARKNIHSRRSSLPPHSVSKSVIVIALAFVITFAFAHNPFSLPRKTNVSGCSHARRRSSRASERRRERGPRGKSRQFVGKCISFLCALGGPVRPRVRPLLSHPSRRRRRPQCHVRAARIPMARPARGSVTPRGEGRGTPRGARGEQQVEGKTQSVVPAGKIMTCATPRANERAASNRMNSCRPRPASPQMKLEGIQYESSLSPSFSSFKLSPTGTSRREASHA